MRFGASLRVAVAVVFSLFFFTGFARADPLRILVAVSSDRGLSTDRPLAHSREDAAGVRDVFTSLGGVAPSKVVFVPDATRGTFFAALDRARAIAAGHDPKEVTLVVYFSGHGDRSAVHLAGESLPLTDLSPRLAAIPAALRIVVVDACRTAEPIHAKGMESEPGFAVTLSSDAATTGTAWLYAAADGQAALESDEIGGAIFTHFWLSGLRGAADANGDGRVTLDESFAYAYGQTLLRSTRSGGTMQRPEAQLQLAAASPVVLTQLAPQLARLELPRGGDTLYLVYGARSQAVIAEVYGLADGGVRLSLSPGRYVVLRRTGDSAAATEVTLDERSERSLQDGDFRAFSEDAVALKGSLNMHPWSMALSDAAFAGIGVDLGDEALLALGWRDRSSAWGVSVGPLGALERRANPFNVVTEKALGGELSLDRFVSLSSTWMLRLGVDARAEWIWQRVTRTDADRLAAAGLAFLAATNHAGPAWGGGAHAGARLWLSNAAFLDFGVRLLALGAKTDTGVESRILGGGSLGLGMSF
jgi:hypothetical protein